MMRTIVSGRSRSWGGIRLTGVTAAVAAALWLAACSSNTGRREAGFVGSSNSAATGNRETGTPIGVGFEALFGGSAKLDEEDKRRAVVAKLQALETGPSGAPVAWRNPDTGRYGNVVPGPVYQENGVECREYTDTVYLDGSPQTEHGAACRRSDGTWASVS
jgi:surface antigen